MRIIAYRVEERAEVLRVYEVSAANEIDAEDKIYDGNVDPVSVEDIESSIRVLQITSARRVLERTRSKAFERPKDIDDYIAIWGMMDSVIRSVKKGAALSFWKRNSVPVDINGKPFTIRSGGRLVRLRYAHLVANRYWYKDYFARDMENWQRLYGVFASVVNMRG